MSEEVKRLVPVGETVRHLFALSGNECAFPNCSHRLIDLDGTFVAQICHIEAAEVGGQRFNPIMTNEDRRAPSNLLLMCHAHHTITNNVVEYPVPRMQRIKADHEARFANVAEKILAATALPGILDERAIQTVTPANSLEKLRLALEFDPEADASALADVRDFHVVLSQVPRRTRTFLLVLLERGNDEGRVPLFEVQNAVEHCYASHKELDFDMRGHLDTLVRWKIGGYEHGEFWLSLDEDCWCPLLSIRQCCKKAGMTLRDVVVELRFDLLD